MPPTDTQEKWAIAKVEDVTVRIYSTSSVGLMSLLETLLELQKAKGASGVLSEGADDSLFSRCLVNLHNSKYTQFSCLKPTERSSG